MNRYDEKFDFRMARPDEVKKIMKFIGDYWPKKNHILATDEDFFRYEFCEGDRVGFFLAVDKETDEIMCCCGTYFYSKEHIPGKTDCSAGILLANPNCKVPFIGWETTMRRWAYLRPRACVAPGANMKTTGTLILKKNGGFLDKMKHFYLLSDRNSYRIAHIQEKRFQLSLSKKQKKLNPYTNIEDMYSVFDDISFKSRKPYKDMWYVNKRYFHHPIYKYQIYGIEDKAAIVFKEVQANAAKILRIVDILGDVNYFQFIGEELRNFIVSGNYEYIDLYELNMPDEVITKTGMVEQNESDPNIIPDYFAPYECKNISIYVSYFEEGDLCFKADGDQDRPNFRA